MTKEEKYPIVLFDGVCHLCDGAVRFILRNERIAKLRFAPLQSETARKLLDKHGYSKDYMQGLVLIENKRAHDRSSACLLISGKLRFPWFLFFPLLVIPKPLRDAFYHVVASMRYKCFGRKESCSLPQGEDLNRFLQ